MKSIKLIRSCGHVDIQNVFVPQESRGAKSDGLDFDAGVQSAKHTVCLVLEDGIGDNVARALAGVKKEVRIYILVRKIDTAKLSKLGGRAIVREVPHVRGSYCIVDDSKVLFFNKSLGGAVIDSADAVKVVKAIFKREFWEFATEEYIEKKRPCAEHTFDIPHIYGNSEVIIDDSFDAETPLATLIDEASVTAYTGKIDSSASGDIIISNINSNADLLRNKRGSGVYLYPDLPFCFLVRDGQTYAVNFDLADYKVLPERGRGRLFAIRLPDTSFGESYKLYGHKTVAELVDKSVILLNGERVEVKRSGTEKRKIKVDLRAARELYEMEGYPQTLEERLSKKDPALLQSNLYAQEIVFTITPEMQPQSIHKKAEIYSAFEDANRKYRDKVKEVEKYLAQLKGDKAAKELESIVCDGEFMRRDAYRKALEALNAFISELNGEDSLSEILGGKKGRKTVQALTPAALNMDIPEFGTLYQSKGEYEYLLRDSRDLDRAIEEMEAAGIDGPKVVYLEEK